MKKLNVLHWGRLLAFPTKMALSWKGLPGTTTLAHYEKSYITAVKSFITFAPGVSVIILFTATIFLGSTNKARVFAGIGWKCFSRINTLAYYEFSYITTKKIFMILGRGVSVILLFTTVIYQCS